MVRFQRTLAVPVWVEGFGYWSDRDIRVVFQPAEENTGVVFVRDDLPGKPRIPVSPERCVEIPHRTALAVGSAHVEMVEHALAALMGMAVDNCEIHVDAAEMPGLDGSALAFAQAFVRAGFVEQGSRIRPLAIATPFRLGEGDDRWMTAAPGTGALELSFTLRYVEPPSIGCQSAAFVLSPERFLREIAPCRTFVTLREAEQIQASGLAKRATYRDILVFADDGPMENTLRFPNECARHKILDLLGDLALVGRPVVGRIHGYCSGHDWNVRLVRHLLRE
ncbi:MAG: UDP-3-O-acyl-N-acetylglucosamine deacetylase [Planctomycetia bacterium]|nr:UDP-3-O-acyl-N-acetylglucosamine deacetylase [Planctomycetia bacterium]